MADYDDDEDNNVSGSGKQSNVLPVWGNEKSMNLNSLILTNIQGSPYFKVQLFAYKTYHEVVDEIYYRVQHVEPWEAGSRKVGGQTGMCGGVRGVGAGGIVSSAFCLLYKLFTLRLTRKQLIGMMDHGDSPFIRCLGFMYARYTFPPADLWDWFKDYLADEEEVDVKAGGGQVMYMGDVVRDFLMKLDWFGALFPRIPVPIQKTIVANMKDYGPSIKEQYQQEAMGAEQQKLEKEREERETREKQRYESDRGGRRDPPREGPRDSHRDTRSRGGERYGAGRDREMDRDGRDRHGGSSRSKHSDSKSRRDRDKRRDDADDFSRELKKAKERVKDERRGGSDRKRSRSREKKKRSRSRERKRSRSRDRSREKDKSSRSRRSRS